MKPVSKISKATKDGPNHSGTMIIQHIPQSTKSDFKGACGKRGKTMRDVLIQFMRDFVKQK